MRLSPEEALAVLEAAVRACPELAALNETEVVGSVFAVVGKGLSDLERAVEEAGGFGQEVAGIFMGYGALAEVLEGMPATDVRYRLFQAGREVGKVLARKWSEKIREALAEKAGTH